VDEVISDELALVVAQPWTMPAMEG